RLAEEDPENTSWIDNPASYCLTPDEQGLSKPINFIYYQRTLHTPLSMTLQQKAIVYPKNETANIINSKVLDMVPGENRLAEEDLENTSWIDNPASYCLTPDEQGLSKPINFIYYQSTLYTPLSMTLQLKAIVYPKNETANIINSKVLDVVPGENSINKSLEAKVYRKWIAKSPPEMTPYAFCCILLDREGNAIESNMALKDADYCNQKLQIHIANRISNCLFESTSHY
nr:DNA helicase [Tanacetum cinerariifolium]